MLYQYLDFPKLPKELELMCLDFKNLKPCRTWEYPSNMSQETSRLSMDSFAKYSQYRVPREVLNWLNENNILTKDIRAAKIHCMHEGQRIHAHVDHFRTCAINYILTESTASTCFYKHKTIADFKETEGHRIISMDDIELIESVILEHHRWHQLDVSAIHNVENITMPRAAITLTPR